MNRSEKARAAGGTAERATDKAAERTSNPAVEFNILDAFRQDGKIETYLRKHGIFGQENALKREKLVELLGYPNIRAFRLDLARERRRGSLVCSTTQKNGGYYMPSRNLTQGRDELAGFVNSCHNRARKVESIAKPMRRALDVLDGQLTINNTEDEGGDGECGTP